MLGKLNYLQKRNLNLLVKIVRDATLYAAFLSRDREMHAQENTKRHTLAHVKRQSYGYSGQKSIC